MLRALSAPVTEDGEAPSSSAKDRSLHNDPVVESKHDRLFNLYIKASSWPAEGRGLLHTLSPLLFTKEFKIRSGIGSYYFSRDESQLSISRSKGEPDNNIIVRLDVVNQGIFLDATDCFCSNIPSEMWEEVPRGPQGFALSIGHIIRFGSYKIRVVDMVLSVKVDNKRLEGLKPFPPQDFPDTSSEHTVARSQVPSVGGPLCRICFEAGDDLNNNTLLSPCACAGSLRYIHVGCLRRWLDGQLQVKQLDQGGGSYLIRTITCEICKSVYSKSVYESVLIPRPNVPHIILEDFIVPDVPVSPSGLASAPTSKIHIVPIVPGKPIRIGRSKEAEVILSDISVSRTHALLELSDGGVRLVDLSSKFGTLVQLPERIFHPVGSSPLRVQIGSSLVEITASHPSRIERILPDAFFQEKGVVKVVKSKSPNERIVEAERLRRSNRPNGDSSPTSPAATLNQSAARSPGVFRDEILDDHANSP